MTVTSNYGDKSRTLDVKLSATDVDLAMKGVTLTLVLVAKVKDSPFKALSQIRNLRSLMGPV